jgi:hypothetical protein
LTKKSRIKSILCTYFNFICISCFNIYCSGGYCRWDFMSVLCVLLDLFLKTSSLSCWIPRSACSGVSLFGSKELCGLLCFVAGGCWYVDVFVLAENSFDISYSREFSLCIFFAFLVSSSCVDSLDSVRWLWVWVSSCFILF